MISSPERQVATELQHRLCRDRRLRAMGWVRHGITSRVGTMQPGEGNVGYGAPRDKELAWRTRVQWSQAIGVSPERLVGIHQMHAADVVVAEDRFAGRGAMPGSGAAGEADALITNQPGLPLMTLHADCQPVLFADPVQRAVGVAHAGWRGVVGNVVGNTVQQMSESYGSDPVDLLVFLGPAIGVECYEVGPEVIERWCEQYRGGDGVEAITAHGAKPHFDLTVANRQLLTRAGVRPEHIEESGVCTMRQGADWFSHRGQGPATGRFAAIIAVHEALV